MFNGRYSEELFKEYRHWLHYIVDLFLPMIDSEKGDYICLPYEGGMLQQPYQTMQILNHIQGCYREIQHEKIKKMHQKSSSSSPRRKRPHR